MFEAIFCSFILANLNQPLVITYLVSFVSFEQILVIINRPYK